MNKYTTHDQISDLTAAYLCTVAGAKFVEEISIDEINELLALLSEGHSPLYNFLQDPSSLKMPEVPTSIEIKL